MTDFHFGLLVLACVFGGALTGMFLGRVLPPHHLGDYTKSVVTWQWVPSRSCPP